MDKITVIDTAGISAFVKLAVDLVKLIKPDASSAVVITVSIILSVLLSSLSALQSAPVVSAAVVYAVITQSIIIVAVAVGLTEVQKKAEAKRDASGEPERKIG